ncbi:MAG: ATP-binding protein [Acidimicrobiales bacterium]
MARRLEPFREYQRRVVDAELDELVPALPALSLEGPRGVGKTSTARRRSGTVVCLDDPGVLEVITAQPDRLAIGTPSIVIDEWQRYPPAWDVVRRAVDENPIGGRFILTGSASPAVAPTHTGAGRVVTLRMRPLTLPERGVDTPVVSRAALLVGDRPDVEGATTVTLEDYTAEILAGGFPGIRHSTARAQRAALDGYLVGIVDADLPELGAKVRRPQTLRRWLQAYAAATATTASYEKIRDAATAGETTRPAKTTTIPYRDALERLWILDPLPAWAPTTDHLARLTFAPEHHLADPALAARLTGVDAGALLRGEGPTTIPRDGTFLGALFESLVTLSVRVFAQAAEARVSRFRTKGAEREVDLISERGDRRILAVEVKLADAVGDGDVRHLVWLADGIGADLLDAMVVTTGRYAYRRPDGIAVVPLALLGA